MGSVKQMMDMGKQMMGDMPEDQKKAMDEQVKAQVAEAVKEVHAQVEKMSNEYKANKAAKDAEAFKVCDKDGNGTLELNEVIEILMPETEKNVAFQKALGFEA